MEDQRKKLEIVTGNGSNLEISPVYEHINTSRPKSSDKKPTNIVIPNSIKQHQDSSENKEDSIDSFDDVTLSDESSDDIETEDDTSADEKDDFDDLFIEEDDNDDEDDNK